MKLWSGLLVAALVMFAAAFPSSSEELLAASIAAGAASAVAYIADLKARLKESAGGRDSDARLADLERRVVLAEGDLELTRLELRRLRDALEFDLQLSDPSTRRTLPRQHP